MAEEIDRFRVRARDADQLRRIRAKLEGKTAIFVESRKRLSLSTGAIPPDTRAEIEAEGAEVSPEVQYDLDA
jgi:hypothetical protein